MPAPKFLAGLPKPALFGLYGAVGGLLGALAFAEPLWQLASPPAAPPPGPQVAVSASKDVEVFVGGQNEFAVQVAREGFDGPVEVRFENPPAGVTIDPVTVPKGATEAKATRPSRWAWGAGRPSVKVLCVGLRPVRAAIGPFVSPWP